MTAISMKTLLLEEAYIASYTQSQSTIATASSTVKFNMAEEPEVLITSLLQQIGTTIQIPNWFTTQATYTRSQSTAGEGDVILS